MTTIGINFKNFNMNYRSLIEKAVVHMEKVLNNELFGEILADEISKSNGLEGELSKWKHASVDEILATLFPITLNLNTYYTRRNVIGYGYPNDKNIYLNTKYLSGYSVDRLLDLMEVGSNLLHEHSHDCGFDHDFKATRRRPNSLSYILNRAYERTFKQLNNIQDAAVVRYYVPWYKKLLPWYWF